MMRMLGLVFALVHLSRPEYSFQKEIMAMKDIDLKDMQLSLKSQSGSTLKGQLGLDYSIEKQMKNCKALERNCKKVICMDDDKQGILTINKIEASVSCYNVEWLVYQVRDCYRLGDRYWYGGGEVENQRWPLENENRQSAAYVTGDFFHYQYGGLVENAWLTSDGFAIYSSPSLDLQVSFNASGDNRLCISSLQMHNMPRKALNYTICSGADVKEITKYMFSNVWKKPESIPDEIMLTEPVWSTWAYYKKFVTQSAVIEYANNVLDSKIGLSHIEIDDKWEDCYGNLQFDRLKFPDPSSMIQQLNDSGVRVTFWVHPFANVECDAFKEGEEKGYWIRKNSSEGPPQLVTWWNGVGGYLDTTNPSATEWYLQRLRSFKKKYNINGFKFDAGEVSWIPQNSFLYNATYVNQFTNQYVQTVAESGDKMAEVRSSHDNQNMNFFLRMLDRNSVWGYKNGLKTLIPASLLFFVFGYPFVLPDMIGGNDELPDKELYIRWLQTNALLPAMQFSFPPWSYDDEVVEIAREMVDLHRRNAPRFIRLANEALRTGVPIIRPLWWIDPKDNVALTIDSEFLVGDELLVAPVLEEGSRSRDIYLPRGTWKDELRNNTHSGPIWLRKYSVDLKELPRFTQI
ncbi:uncharacterized protein LOC111618155 isoform X1 [Centruroides sculpturatus]|uniref:uncharacterized protein LOC111618155 isoform X1 n=1 Tax=Centruroides sculpturatus TaxID=218467 RepID=UPI000C6F01D9|nr:uncharacterized protein LOC111618155 isoform X1 [Centruroides sculpturatus]